MPLVQNTKGKGGLIGRLDCGSDLLGALTSICNDNGVTLGTVSAIGAVQKARIGYYHQDTHKYEFREFDQHMEILAVIGNISIKDGEPIVHAHITLSDREGRAFGGHLSPGTVVFACEYVIEIMTGPRLERGFDEQTGLPLWPLRRE